MARDHRTDLEHADWKHILAYRERLLKSDLKTSAVERYMNILASYYLLRAAATAEPGDLEICKRLKTLLRPPRRRAEPATEPFSLPTLRRIIGASKSYTWVGSFGPNAHESEDYVLVMTLLYTGGRSQVYSLRVEDIDFKAGTVLVFTKGRGKVEVPLHPTLAQVLRDHLAHRPYESPFVFRFGRDCKTHHDFNANHLNARACCSRVQRAAGLKEKVRPHRFRATLATYARELGLTIEQVQAILGHSNPVSTMHWYSRPRMEEVKRVFARVDLLRPDRKPPKPSVDQLARALQRLAPEGREEAWAMLVQGFAELFGAARTEEDTILDYGRLPWTSRYLRR